MVAFVVSEEEKVVEFTDLSIKAVLHCRGLCDLLRQSNAKSLS